MKKKLMMSVSALAVVALTAVVSQKTLGTQTAMADLMLSENIEALTAGEDGGSGWVCYPQSRVQVGYTYYDCRSCKKVYDERGKGNPSKCF